MKNQSAVLISVMVVFAMTVQTTFAQDDAPTFGVKVGLNLANISLDPEPEGVAFSAATKFGLGGIMLYPLSEVLDLQVEVMYLLKGSKADFDLLGTTFELEFNSAYISVPVMGRYNLSSEDIAPFIVAGPEFGFLLSAKSKVLGVDVDVKETTKSIDLGFNVGVGASMNNMFGEVRYSLGLADTNDDPDDPDTSVKNTGIQAFVGMMF